MAVSEDTRKVQRPKNTIVDDNGREGPLYYEVRERANTKYISGGNPQPKNGWVIGHITDGKFVPIQKNTVIHGNDIKVSGEW